MLRAVLAVALAAALLGAVTPALEDARATRTDRLAARELGRVESAAAALVREEAPGARRTLELSLPGESPTAAPLAFVALGGLPDDSERGTVADTDEGDVLAYRVAGGPVRVRRVGVDLRVMRGDERAESDSRVLVFERGGSHRVTLRLVRVRGRSVVVVSARKGSMDGGVDDSRLDSSRATRFGPVDFEGTTAIGAREQRARGPSSAAERATQAAGEDEVRCCAVAVTHVPRE